MFYNTLIAKKRMCPEDCNACIEVCPNKTPSGVTAIKKVKQSDGTYSITACNQCSQPECVPVCSTEALIRNEQGVVELDPELCIGCGACVDVCAYEGIQYDPDWQKAVKCDYCQGKPKCVEACPNGILSWAQSRPVTDWFKDEDLLSPGLTFCSGCPAELGVRFTVRVLGKKIIMFGAPSCTLLTERANIPYYGCLMTNVSSSMTGVSRYLRRIGEDVTCVAYVGDGTTADIGFQSLSGACERGENIIHICYDNEGYMNTGIQRSSTTPPGSWTTTTQIGPASRGKSRPPKYVPLLLALQGASYVATATLSHLEDFAMKLSKAQNVKDGLSYIHVFAPCPTGWRGNSEDSIDACRVAVETNYFPLWEAEKGVFRFTTEVKKPRPLTDFVKLARRFAHFNDQDLRNLQSVANDRYQLIKHLACKS